MNSNETIQLQGIGKRKAIPAQQLKAGMIILWNFGYKSIVINSTISKTGKTITLETENENGKRFIRKTTVNRLFAVE